MGCGPSVPATTPQVYKAEQDQSENDNDLAQSADQSQAASAEIPAEQREEEEGDGDGEVHDNAEDSPHPDEEPQSAVVEVASGEAAPLDANCLEEKQADKMQDLDRQVEQFHVGELDELQTVQRFKLVFVRQGPGLTNERARLLKREMARVQEGCEYRILRYLSSLDDDALKNELVGSKLTKLQRCKSALPGFVGEFKKVGNSSPEGAAGESDLMNQPEAENSVEEHAKRVDARDSALGSADGLVTPHNTLMEGDNGQANKDRGLATKDEQLIVELLQDQLPASAPQSQPGTEAHAVRKSQVEPESSQVTASKTFVVEEKAKLDKNTQQKNETSPPTEKSDEKEPLPPPQEEKVDCGRKTPNKENEKPTDGELEAKSSAQTGPKGSESVSRNSKEAKVPGRHSHQKQVSQMEEEENKSDAKLSSRPSGNAKSRPTSSTSRHKLTRQPSNRILNEAHPGRVSGGEPPSRMESRPPSRTSSTASQHKRGSDQRPAPKSSRSRRK